MYEYITKENYLNIPPPSDWVGEHKLRIGKLTLHSGDWTKLLQDKLRLNKWQPVEADEFINLVKVYLNLKGTRDIMDDSELDQVRDLIFKKSHSEDDDKDDFHKSGKFLA